MSLLCVTILGRTTWYLPGHATNRSMTNTKVICLHTVMDVRASYMALTSSMSFCEVVDSAL